MHEINCFAHSRIKLNKNKIKKQTHKFGLAVRMQMT